MINNPLQPGSTAGLVTAVASIAAVQFSLPVEIVAGVVGGIFMLFNDSSFSSSTK